MLGGGVGYWIANHASHLLHRKVSLAKTDTPANRASQPDADHARWVSPEQIAGVIRFLCSDDSAPTSGAHIPVYGRA